MSTEHRALADVSETLGYWSVTNFRKTLHGATVTVSLHHTPRTQGIHLIGE
jgi:hypothetical protein